MASPLFANSISFWIKSSCCGVGEYYHKYDAQRGTQFVFSDLGTYKPGEWNVYSEIKRKLIEDYGIPAHEIRFIQECKTERSRKAVIQAMNDGDVRVLFGSTSMLGTGVNAQKRAVCIHHLDTPWRPSDLTQRDGRAIRAGNEIAKLYADNKVDVIIYAVEKSLDSYKFNLLHCKATFIAQLKSGALGARTIDEGSMDEKNGMNFSEYMAILSGNTDLLDKAKLEKRIAALESERKSFNKGRGDSEFKLQTITHDIANNEAAIERMKADWERYDKVVQRDKEGNPVNNLTIDTCNLFDEKNMGIHLHSAAILRSRAASSDLSCFSSSSLPHVFAMMLSRIGTSALSLAVRSSYWAIMPGIFSKALTKFMQAAWVSAIAN